MGITPRKFGRVHGKAVVAGLLLITLVVAGCGGSSVDQPGGGEEDSDDVKVGLLVPLSGVYAPLGEDMRAGFQLYLDQHDGQLAGRTVELVVADEGDGPETGVPAAQRLVTQDQVAMVVGIVSSAVALGVRDLFEESQVPLIVANAGANAITGEQGSDYIWRTSFSSGKVSGALGAAVAEEVDGEVYLIAPDYAAGEEMVAGFRETFEAAGGTVADEAYTPFGTTQDFQPFLSEIRNSGAAAVYAFYAGAEAVSFVQQYSEFGLAEEIPLYGPGFLTEGGVLAAQGEAALGVRTSLHYSAELDTPGNQEFVEAYTSANDRPPTVYAVQAYDAAAVLDLALVQASDTSGQALVAALRGIGPIDSPRGQWQFDDTHDPDQTFYLREVQADGDALVNAVVGELG
jgi:branched-chain amino acid transport system substrate-binding protein